MKHLLKTAMCILAALLSAALAQTTPPAAGGSASTPELNSVLTLMDQTAEKFRTTEADFVWDQFAKVVNETDTQKGKLYFRRTKSGVEYAAQITEPTEKYVLVREGKVRVYQPGIDQETVYQPGKSKADLESFLMLGFGGRGHDLEKSFDVRYLGTEEAQGIKADKLELVPKSQRARNTFSQILLWIDPARGVSVQQELLEPSGDYRLAKYSNIQINTKIADNVFKLKTSGRTKVVSP
ncbi:MAG TPA: outer membrane lipoprotein carrier protein LolA [Terriglobales bacterium]|nr:outer membrane lipoprotein carrier protein LolA [Terriglobales bacterium]